MNLTAEFSQSIQNDANLNRTVHEANRLLEKVTEEAYFPINANWDYATTESEGGIVRLNLTHSGEISTTRIAPTEFKDDFILRSKLLSVWGNLLQNKAKSQLAALVKQLNSAEEKQ